MQYGITPEISSLLPFEVDQVQAVDANCLCFETNAFWIYHGREENLKRQQSWLRILGDNGVQGFFYPNILKNGNTYGNLTERDFFYCTSWMELRHVVFHKQEDLRALVKMLTDFRVVMTGNKEPRIITQKQSLLEYFPKIIGYLKNFELLAKHRINSSRFDYLASGCFEALQQQAAYAYDLLKNSVYQERLSDAELMINKISRSNLRIDQQGQIYFLRLNNFNYEVPSIDFAVFFNKVGRFIKWNFEWFWSLLADYQERFPMDEAELVMIYAYLVFPWNISRLMLRYYFNYVNWPLSLLVERLERLLVDEICRQKFLEIFAQKIKIKNI